MSAIGFIGGGAMAEAIIKGLLAHGYETKQIIVSDKSGERLDYLQQSLGINVSKDNLSVVKKCAELVLAVKPQNLAELMEEIAPHCTKEHLVISIMAGISTATIEKYLSAGSRVVRVMPNTPALVGAGTTVLAAGSKATDQDLAKAQSIFRAVGSVNVLPEKLLNAVTGLSGSGPAYVYLFIEALSDAGVLAGLPRDVALELAVETVRGTAQMVSETKEHPAKLKDKVTSPAGTTIYGLLELEKSGLRGVVMEAVLAASKRAGEM
ncbi:MAG: pyrroline-5-carboxylate reductase [Peptococcia bacterium]